jgi:hypothetical protein
MDTTTQLFIRPVKLEHNMHPDKQLKSDMTMIGLLILSIFIMGIICSVGNTHDSNRDCALRVTKGLSPFQGRLLIRKDATYANASRGALDIQTPAMSRSIRLNSGLCFLHITKNRETNIMNNPKLPYAPFRFIPRQDDIEHFKMLCLFVHPQNPDDLAKRYSYFGAQFGYDLGMVQRNTATIQGTPSISAAGQMALVRMNPNTTYLRETERSDEASTWELKRNDEPDDVIHVIRVTYDMAVQAGWAKGHMWNKIRGAMLSARAGAWVCRIGMPEVCSGMYTIDEMADSVGLQGEELDEAMALSFGTNADLTRSPQPMPQPTATTIHTATTSASSSAH